MRRAGLSLMALALAGVALAGVAYTRFNAPEPVAATEYECTTCDARQASKTRLREHLKSLPD